MSHVEAAVTTDPSESASNDPAGPSIVQDPEGKDIEEVDKASRGVRKKKRGKGKKRLAANQRVEEEGQAQLTSDSYMLRRTAVGIEIVNIEIEEFRARELLKEAESADTKAQIEILKAQLADQYRDFTAQLKRVELQGQTLASRLGAQVTAQVATETCLFREENRAQKAELARLRKDLAFVRKELQDQKKEGNDLQERQTLMLEYLLSLPDAEAGKSVSLSKLSLRALLDAGQAKLAAATGMTWSSEGLIATAAASREWRRQLSYGIDDNASKTVQDRLRLRNAYRLLDQAAITRVPSVADLKASSRAMKILTQTNSWIRNDGNMAAHNLVSPEEMVAIIDGKAAGLGAPEKLAMHDIVKFLLAPEL